jgi:hypothetical protein
VALALLAVAVVGWLVLGYAVPAAVVLARDKPAFAAAVDGSWLLWVVATQSVSTAAALAGSRTLPELATVTAVTTWAVGVVLYLALMSLLLLLRLLVASVAPRQMTTPYWIVGATRPPGGGPGAVPAGPYGRRMTKTSTSTCVRCSTTTPTPGMTCLWGPSGCSGEVRDICPRCLTEDERRTVGKVGCERAQAEYGPDPDPEAWPRDEDIVAWSPLDAEA